MRLLIFLFSFTSLWGLDWQNSSCDITQNQYLKFSYSSNRELSASCDDSSEMSILEDRRNKLYSCSGNTIYIAQGWNDITVCSNYHSAKIRTVVDIYTVKTKQDCGSEANADSTNTCVCNIPSMEYDDTTQGCSCPSGTSYNGDFCETSSCSPLASPYQFSSFLQSECTQSNLQALYNQNNTDGRQVSSVTWHCDNKCYFILDGVTGEKGDKGDTGEQGIQGEQGIAGTDGINGTDGVDGIDGTNGIDGINGIDGVNGTDGTDGINGTNGTNGLDGTQGVQGIAGINGVDGQDAPSGEYTAILSQINSSIVNGSTNTVDAIDDIKNMHEGEADSDTSFFDSFQTYYDDIGASVELVENNVNDLMATIQGDYTPQFQNHNSCTINFPIMNKSIPVNMCRYSSMLRPFFTFILTIAMLILLIRLHFYLFPKVYKSD